MLVEFIGAAGAGKSFLADRILRSLMEKGIAASNFDSIAFRKTSPRNLLMAARAAYLSLMARQKSLSCYARTFTIITRYSIRRVLCEQVSGIYITSEGLCHRIITMYRNSKVPDMYQLASMLYRRIDPPDVVVVVEVSPGTIFSRRSARNRADDIFTPESVNADAKIISESIEVMTQIKRTLHPPMRIMRVNAEEEGARGAIAEILAALESDYRSLA